MSNISLDRIEKEVYGSLSDFERNLKIFYKPNFPQIEPPQNELPQSDPNLIIRPVVDTDTDVPF